MCGLFGAFEDLKGGSMSSSCGTSASGASGTNSRAPFGMLCSRARIPVLERSGTRHALWQSFSYASCVCSTWRGGRAEVGVGIAVRVRVGVGVIDWQSFSYAPCVCSNGERG